MLGLRLFSFFTLLLASLFIQKSFDVESLLASTEQVTSAQKNPHFQVVGAVKLVAPKHKSHKSFFLLSHVSIHPEKFAGFAENFSGFEAFFPKPTFENPSRAPPVV